jgi:DNA-binding transcriptional ArsR family regulator
MTLAPEVRRGGNLPFGMVASRWMCDPRYSANARVLYAILVSYAGTQSRDTADGKPYRKELARQLGVSLSTLDRTLAELDVAGLVTIERRIDPGNPAVHEASIYHLHDAGVMWHGNGTWEDPLPAGASAAAVAKAQAERRRSAKRTVSSAADPGNAATEDSAPRGGVTSDATPRNTPIQAYSDTDASGGGRTGDATGSRTGDARVAAPVTPDIEIPNQIPSPEAPSARSAADARRASHPGVGLSGEGGDAASGVGTPAQRPHPHRTPLLRADVSIVVAALPPELTPLVEAASGTAVPRTLVTAIKEQLGERSAEQLAERVARRWHTHGYAGRHAAGAVTRPVGVAVALVRAGECGHARCEDGVDLDTGAACTACTERRKDHRADNRADRRHQDARQITSAPDEPTCPTRQSTCPGCGVPGSSGVPCIACRSRHEVDAETPHMTERGHPDADREAAPHEVAKARCTACRARIGRARWGGLCGPCAAADVPAAASC